MPVIGSGGAAVTVWEKIEDLAESQAPIAEATMTLKCAWDKRFQLVQNLLPAASWTGTAITRTVGYPYPRSTNLRAESVTRIKGIGNGTPDVNGWFQHKEAEVTVQFIEPSYTAVGGTASFGIGSASTVGAGVDPSGQPWTTTTFETAAEILKIPRGFKLANGDSIDEAQAGLPFPTIGFRMKRHWCPILPLSLIVPHVGKVNDNAIWISDYLFPRGCLLMAGFDTEVTTTFGGLRTQTCSYSLLGRPQGIEWNKALSRSGTWEFINTVVPALSGKYPFDYVNFGVFP